MNGDSRSDGGGMIGRLTPVVKSLLILNALLYFADLLVFDFAIRLFGAFTINTAIYEGKVWEFITFQFIHGSVGHLLMNSIGLFFFGPWMERWWGSKYFLLFYLVCGAAGAGFLILLTYLGILPMVGMDTGLVGASAGIYGILIGVAVVAPSLRVTLLIPPVTLSMRQMALIIMALAAGSILFRVGGNEGGEAGHLGGAIMGGILVWLWRFEGPAQKTFGRRRRPMEAKIRPRTVIDLRTSTVVDEILDKISREGFQSLTEEEKEKLQEAAKRGKD